MKKLNDIKKVKNKNSIVVLTPEAMELMDKILNIVKEFNINSVNKEEYTVVFNPIESFKSDKLGGFGFSLLNKNQILFEHDTNTGFFLLDEEYEKEEKNRDYYDSNIKEKVYFNNNFYNDSQSFFEIIEDKMVNAFLKVEKEANRNNQFQDIIKINEIISKISRKV